MSTDIAAPRPRAHEPLFREPLMEGVFQAEGYLVRPLLGAAEVAALLDAHEQLAEQPITGFHTTAYSSNLEVRHSVDVQIRSVVGPALRDVLSDFRIWCGVFSTKGTGPDSDLGVHQDSSIVDERRFASLTVWIPLVDVGVENGTLHLLPRSHRLSFTYRSSSIPGFGWGVQKEIRSLSQPMILRAGEAVFFDSSIFHFSPPNASTRPRVAVQVLVSGAQAKVVTALHDPARHPLEIELFEQADDFHLTAQTLSRTDRAPHSGRSIGRVAYNFPRLTRDALERIYGPIP